MKLALSLFIFSTISYAAGDGSGSILDLAWPALNFTILFSFLFVKLKKPIVDGYINLSNEIENKVNSAQKAEKEASDFLKEQKDFEKNSEEKLSKLVTDFDLNWDKQKKILESEYSQKTEKLYSDYENKLKSERKKIEAKLSSELLENIIQKTSSSISSSPEKKSSAMRNFLQ